MSSHPKTYEGLLTTIAAANGCTEFAVFDREQEPGRLRPLCHVRGDGRVEGAVAEAAVKAFQEITRQCVSSEQDGVIELEEPSVPARPRFCLVILARRAGTVVGAASFIARCDNESEARILLKKMRLEAERFRNGPPPGSGDG